MLRAVVVALCALAGCSGVAPPAASPGAVDPLPDDAWSDVVVPETARRDRPRAAPAAERRPPAPLVRPGEVDVLIGEPGDGRALDPAPEPGDGGGFEDDFDETGDDERGRPPRLPRRLHLVVDAPYESWAADGTFVHVLALTPALRPAPGAEVFRDGRLVGRTEAHGVLVFRSRPGLADAAATGVLHVRHGGLSRTVRYESNARTASFEASTVYAYTDRGVYSPGQTIELRAIAWTLRGEYRALAERELEVLLVDPDGRVAGGGALRTDAWGVGALSLPLPLHAPRGAYTLLASHGEERARAHVLVQPFVAPAIEIDHDLGRFLTPRVHALTAEVRLRYFDGGEVGAATLEVEARIGERTLGRAEVAVSGPGPHRVTLGPAVLRAVHAAATEGRPVEIALSVTDAHGRRDTVRRLMEHTRNPYRATIELDRSRYAAADPVVAMVRLVDLDGVPQRDVAIELEAPRGRPRGFRGTEAEIERAYEAMERMPEGADRQRWTERTDEGGVARFTFPMPVLSAALDDAVLLARIADVADPIAAADLPFAAPLPMRSAVSETVVDEGADIEVEVAFPLDATPIERVVHADVVDSSGSIVHSALVPIVRRGGRPVAVGSVRAPTWGSMLLTLFCVGRRGGDVGLMTDGQNIVVRPGTRLRVTLGGVPERAAPGDRVRATITVTDREGRPRDAALGVSLVDEAVLSLLDPLERTPYDRFYNPDRKVLASTGAQTLTWPWVSRTWGVERIDLAWPETFGWHEGRSPRWALRARSAAPSTAMESGGSAPSGEVFDLYAAALDAAPAPGSSPRSPARLASDPAPPVPPPTTVILRTRFDETALWLPRAVTEQGRAEVDARLPDAIGEQRFTVVASDREGGIATATSTVAVRQELYVRADVPPSLTEGDRVEVGVAVRNLGDRARRVRVGLSSRSLRVSGEPTALAVPAGGTGVARFEVTAAAPGPATYEATAETTGEPAAVRDVERRAVRVDPRGAPVVERFVGMAHGGTPLASRFVIAPDDRHHVVRVGVVMPTVAPAIQGLDALVDEGYFGPDPAASRVLAATAVYAYLERTGQIDEPRRAELRRLLAELASAILLAQGLDGGWGWVFSRGSVPYVTAYVLDALLELAALDFPVPPEALARAGERLARSFDDGHLDVSDIAPWEGETLRVRRAATAHAFDVMTRLPEAARAGRVATAIERAAARLEAAIAEPGVDPLTLAHSIRGLRRLRGAAAALDGPIRRLADIRRTVHWEPGWFDAWGGAVEAAAVVLEVLADVDRDGFEVARRDAIRFILHARGGFGAWHGARGTAYAIRALCLVEPGIPGDRGVLEVRVDGRSVRRVEVSGSDVYAAALASRRIEIGGLTPGAHELEVAWSGRVSPRVEVAVERWPAGPVGVARDVAGAGAVDLSRRAPPEVRRGAPFEIELTVAARSRLPALVVEQPLPAAVEPDAAGLDGLVAAGALASWDRRGATLRLGWSPGPARTIAVPLVAARRGRVTIPPARLRPIGGAPIAIATGARLTIE